MRAHTRLMSSPGVIEEELEVPSELHLVDWPLLLAVTVFFVSCVVLAVMCNAFFTDPPVKYSDQPRTTYEPPDKSE